MRYQVYDLKASTYDDIYWTIDDCHESGTLDLAVDTEDDEILDLLHGKGYLNGGHRESICLDQECDEIIHIYCGSTLKPLYELRAI